MSIETVSRADAEPAPSAGAEPKRGRRAATGWLPLSVLLAGTFMSVLDFFIVNVAMPDMQSSLHAGASSLEWVVAGYALSSSVLLIAGGRLGDRYGRRRLFVIGLALFTFSSVLCGAAPDTALLVAGRLIQGLGAALFTTNVISLIGVLYPGEDRTRAMAAYGMVMGVAGVGGQLFGGALLALNLFGLGWRSCFLINLPIGVIALLAAPRVIPESRGQLTAGLDLRGVGLITAGLTALVLPLVQGQQAHWAGWVWITLALSAVILTAFVAQQRRLSRAGGTPLIELELFGNARFCAGVAAQTLFWMGQASFFLILALYLQSGRGLSPMQGGLMFTTLAVTYLATSMVSPQLAVRHGKTVITVAALVLAVGHALLITTLAVSGSSASVLWLIPALAVIGGGMGLGIAPLSTNLLATLKPEQAGAAAGTLSTAQYVGSALGVALVGAVFFSTVGHGYQEALEHSLAVLVVVLAGVAALSRLLP